MNVDPLIKEVFRYKETNCTFTADNPEAITSAKASITYHRAELERYIRENPVFQFSLSPVPVAEGPLVVKLMAEAAKAANVGPMAAVAGVLADLAVKDMTQCGCNVAVIENGGEVFAVSDRKIDVGFLAGDSPLSKRIGFRLEKFPIGIATSSGLYSHALSFGEAEAITVFSSSAGLADAAATAVGNLVKGRNCCMGIERGLKKGLSIEGVEGVFIVYRRMVGTVGKIPRILGIRSE